MRAWRSLRAPNTAGKSRYGRIREKKRRRHPALKPVSSPALLSRAVQNGSPTACPRKKPPALSLPKSLPWKSPSPRPGCTPRPAACMKRKSTAKRRTTPILPPAGPAIISVCNTRPTLWTPCEPGKTPCALPWVKAGTNHPWASILRPIITAIPRRCWPCWF